MARNEIAFKPPSLAHLFEAPEEYCGEFGWLCGYSADARFLNDAIERFVQQTLHQRSHVGRIALALLIDPGNLQISPIEVPGVIHLPINIDKKPFNLLHAKVAVLGFRHTKDSQRWRVRLIVSTGNWTRETLEETLDLAWSIDISSNELIRPGEHVRKACADLKYAWDMLRWLRQSFDCRVLDAVPTGRQDTESFRNRLSLEEWMDRVTSTAGNDPERFIDNRSSSLLDQILSVLKSSGKAVSRNYLGLGSGFYESSQTADKAPPVLEGIIRRLKDDRLISNNPEVDIFVNPLSCQAVASSWQSITRTGWTIREAGQPKYFDGSPRALHAKFIFSANYRSNSSSCNSSWLYLGSGNLTKPGFMSRMSSTVGNLEAGVVLSPEDLLWWAERGASQHRIVTNVLPMQWDSEIDSPTALQRGADMPERSILFRAPPISCLAWKNDQGVGRLGLLETASQPFDVLDGAGKKCRAEQDGSFIWAGDRPRQIEILWPPETGDCRAFVPVIDEYGRVAATALSRIDIDEAWWRLADFPMPPDEEALAPPEENDALERGNDRAAAGVKADAAYPARRMMQLVENIAAKQISVSQADWRMWCTRLEQCLCQVAENPAVKSFQDMGINPISPLWYAPFRPSFAERTDQREGAEYEDVLKRVENTWNVAALTDMGKIK